jgi:hypothetical protein
MTYLTLMRKIKQCKQAKAVTKTKKNGFTYVKLEVESARGPASFLANPDPDLGLDRHQHGNSDPGRHSTITSVLYGTVPDDIAMCTCQR